MSELAITTNTIIIGDALQALRRLPSESVQCAVTSPPYFGLRDYNCAGQIGLEPTPKEYIAALVEVFREVRRVLKSDGTLFLNLGDSYARDSGYAGGGNRALMHLEGKQMRMGKLPPDCGLKAKDLVGIPWMAAFALRDDGWFLRQDIIWSKPNPMPESVRDRCTKSHEYVFLLSKSARYFYDQEAIAEPVAESTVARLSQDLESQNGSERVPGKANGNMKAVGRPQLKRALQLAEEKGLTPAHIEAIRAVGLSDAGKAAITQTGAGKNAAEVQRLADEAKEALGGYFREFLGNDTRNARSVWNIATQPFKEAHFAVFPTELARRCILAGSREEDTVLDCFFGAGTTGLAATRLNRKFIGIELNPGYAALAERRIRCDNPLFTEIETVTL